MIDGSNATIPLSTFVKKRIAIYPIINSGYYYLKEQGYYMYSEPIKTLLAEKDLPTAEHIKYVNGEDGIGALLSPKSQNILKDSSFESTDWKKAKMFSGNLL